MRFAIRVLAIAAAFFLISTYLPFLFKVGDYVSALIVAAVLAGVNALVRPFVAVITLPIDILTLGLFSFVVNAIMLYIVAKIVPNHLTLFGVWQTLVGAVILGLVSAVVNRLVKD